MGDETKPPDEPKVSDTLPPPSDGVTEMVDRSSLSIPMAPALPLDSDTDLGASRSSPRVTRAGAELEIAPELKERAVGGRYILERMIGAGSMGAIFKARQLPLKKVVALKVMQNSLAQDPLFAERFYREAKAASLFNHPNCVSILDFGREPDGMLYLVMEYLSGRSLDEILTRKGALSPAQAANILVQVLSALARAHDAGIVHRDLKPENIMIVPQKGDGDGEIIDFVKVFDFGIAQMASDTGGRLTMAGRLVGTPDYMSPEQAEAKEVDHRTDLYAAGVLLYQMLTGALPFTGDTAMKIMIEHITREPDPPSSRLAGLDTYWDRVCLKAMAKKPEDRYANAREMRREVALGAEVRAPMVSGSFPSMSRPSMDLIALQDSKKTVPAKTRPPSPTSRVPPPSRLPRRSRRPRVLFAIGGAIVVLLAATLLLRVFR